MTATGPTCVAANTASTAAVVLGEQAPAWLAGTRRHRPPGRTATVGAARTGGWPARPSSPEEAARMTDGPLLWYLNRGTGLVLLVAAHRSRRVLGVLATRGRRRARRAALRHASPCTATSRCSRWCCCSAHVTTAVVDTYVDIRWWQALVPRRRDLPAAVARARHRSRST